MEEYPDLSPIFQARDKVNFPPTESNMLKDQITRPKKNFLIKVAGLIAMGSFSILLS